MGEILVALDGSERAPQVLAAAAELAVAQSKRLRAVRAVTLPVDVPPEAFEVTPNELVHVLERRARDEVQALTKAVPGGLVADVEVHVGVPWQVICRAAQDASVDLIVIGSHGYTFADRVLGTTAAKVVNHADRPVLVVRPLPPPRRA